MQCFFIFQGSVIQGKYKLSSVLDEIRQNINEEMQQLISDTSEQLQTAVKARREGESVADKEIEGITNAQNELQRLLIQLKEIRQDD